MNKQISARVLEPIVWNKVLEIIRNPVALREGYEEALDLLRESQARKIAQIETLERGLLKVKQKRQNLNDAYLDPDIEMSKTEYLDQKLQLDEETKSIESDLVDLRAEITDVPEPASVDALEQFSSNILEELSLDEEITFEKKRLLFKLMHLRVILRPDGHVRLDGWFDVPETNGLLDATSARYARRPRPLRGRA
jgi:hypothetical protein